MKRTDFTSLPERITTIIPILDDILSGKEIPEMGIYKEVCEEFRTLGGSKFRNKKQLENRLKRSRPGYYGKLGTSIIARELFAGYLYSESPLTEEELGPFQDVEFIYQILVPTTAVVLIQQDLEDKTGSKVTWETAHQYMLDTAEYGDLLVSEGKETSYDCNQVVVFPMDNCGIHWASMVHSHS
jgi:hypothetical protein